MSWVFSFDFIILPVIRTALPSTLNCTEDLQKAQMISNTVQKSKGCSAIQDSPMQWKMEFWMTNRVSQEIDMIVRVLWAKSRSNRGFQFQLSILTGFFDPKSENQEINYGSTMLADKRIPKPLSACGLATTTTGILAKRSMCMNFYLLFLEEK